MAIKYLPLGLITSDEVVYAGGFGGASNSSYWLYTAQYYWTMSPSNASNACVFYVATNGTLENGNNYHVSRSNGVRPVINLDKNVQLFGSGTTSDPFRIGS